MRNSILSLVVCSFALAVPGARAQDNAVAVPPPLVLKDLTPHDEHHGPGHGGSHGHSAVETLTGHHVHGGFTVEGEYLLLRARRGANDFAISDPTTDLIPNGRLESLNYQLRGGFRVGLGYRFAGTAWDTLFTYSYFRAGAERFLTAPAGGTLYATMTRPALNDEVNSAAATGRIEYNVFDAVAGRRMLVEEAGFVRAFAGFRWASIRQNLNVAYDGNDANVGEVRTTSNFTGFGPTVGLDSTWNLTEHWFLSARGSAALMTGSIDSPHRETNNAGLTTYVNLETRNRRVVPVASLALAGGWRTERVFVRAGYEITNWFGLIESKRLTGELAEGHLLNSRSDLSLEGFFVQFGVAF